MKNAKQIDLRRCEGRHTVSDGRRVQSSTARSGRGDGAAKALHSFSHVVPTVNNRPDRPLLGLNVNAAFDVGFSNFQSRSVT